MKFTRILLMALVMIMAQTAWAQKYQLSGDHVCFYPEGSIKPITEAEAGQTITVGVEYDQLPAGKYFTGSFKAEPEVAITMLETGDGTFVMPANDLKVSAVLAEQEEYELNLSSTTDQEIPETLWLLLYCLDAQTTYDDKGGRLLDLNLDGKQDLQLTEKYDEAAQTSIF